MKIKTQTKVLT